MNKQTIKTHLQKKLNTFFDQLDAGMIDPDSVFVQTRKHNRETLATGAPVEIKAERINFEVHFYRNKDNRQTELTQTENKPDNA